MCSAYLLKYKLFREQCLQVQEILKKRKDMAYTLRNGKHVRTHKLTTSMIKIVECIEENDVEVDSNDNGSICNDLTRDSSNDSSKCNDEMKVDTKSDNISIDVCEYNKTNTENVRDPCKNTHEVTVKEPQQNPVKFESKENLSKFENTFDVNITILTREEQMTEIVQRKASMNYLSRPVRCEECFRGFMDDDDLKKHFAARHDPKKGDVICEFCHYKYTDGRGLNQHLKSHRLKFACKQCNYVSRTIYSAKEHYRMHTGKLHKCQYCGKTYEIVSSYLTHVRLNHPTELSWCNICGESFVSQFGLRMHTRIGHRHCNKVFTTESRYSAHYRRMHVDKVIETPRPWICEVCGKICPSKCLLVYHQRNHTGERPYQCKLCTKGFTMKRLLQSHLRVHSVDRPYTCQYCSKSFKRLPALKTHEKVHTQKTNAATENTTADEKDIKCR